MGSNPHNPLKKELWGWVLALSIRAPVKEGLFKGGLELAYRSWVKFTTLP